MNRDRGKKARREQAARQRRKVIGVSMGGAALAALVIIGVLALGAKDAAAAPVWLATTIEGEKIGSDAFQGDVYVMDFFFLTCGICEIQLPQNKAMIDALAGRDDFHFVSITADPADTAPLIREHQTQENATWPHVRDTYGLYQKFQVRGNPNLVFIDRDGNVALTVTELAKGDYLLRQAQRLLDGEAPTEAGEGETRPAEHGGAHPTSVTPQGDERRQRTVK